jgi:acetolactate synthase-1/2/3 large subunit
MSSSTTAQQRPAAVVVKSLANAGVKLVFGIPGAKVDPLFNELMDHPDIKLVVCRHEQNAGFIAAAIGRLTGRPGVCVATSGPGATNLTTALATANTEGDPVVALVGSVPRKMSLVKTHQSLRVIDVLHPIAKMACGIQHEDQVAEELLSAFRIAASHPQGVAVLDLPLDIMSSKQSTTGPFSASAFEAPLQGPAPQSSIVRLAKMIDEAKLPVFLLGMRASDPKVTAALHQFLGKHPIPVLETFQAAGCVSRELLHLFYGRLGLFRNQPGDELLAHSDLVITVGYDPTEYDPPMWNPTGRLHIAHVDVKACDWAFSYQPTVELVGSIDETLLHLAEQAEQVPLGEPTNELCKRLSHEFYAWKDTKDVRPSDPSRPLIHPLHFISTLQSLVADDTVVCCDIGTVYIYMSRYFFSYLPRHFLVSNGQQTLGVALPWAIAASLIQHPTDPSQRKKVISISGDGGFMFTSQELSTAVQQGCDITHFIWNDNQYNMVAIQEEAKYGRESGVDLGGVDFVKFAEAFDAKGWKVGRAGDLETVMKTALAHTGVAVVEVPIDYSRNADLMAHVISDDVN